MLWAEHARAGREHARVLGGLRVVRLDRRLVDANVLRRNDIANLRAALDPRLQRRKDGGEEEGARTRCLKVNRSFWVSVSALAMTGIRFTRVPSRFMISMSSGLSL